MKALTICQPYAELICLPTTDPRHKRVENRTWETKYRGRLYIHAGRSRDWMTTDFVDGIEYELQTKQPVERLAFGAVVAIAVLVDCVNIQDVKSGKLDQRYPWLGGHQHTSGPWCWILDDLVTRVGPYRYKGQQGLFDINPANLTKLVELAPPLSFQDKNAAGPEDVAGFDA